MEAKQPRRIGLAVVLLLVIPCVVVCAQFSIQLPGSVQPGTYTGYSIDFGDVEVGTTKTVTYRFGVTSTSSTTGSLTFIGFQGGFFRKPPFALTNLPSLPQSIAPGGSITFNVTFTPTTTRTYTDQFTITVSGGWPTQVKTHTVTLTGRGITLGGQQDGSYTGSPVYDLTGLQTTLTSTSQDVSRLEAKLDLAQQDTRKLETKLDTLGPAVEDLRTKLVTLAFRLGKLLTGKEISLYPMGTVVTEPLQPSIVDLLSRLEAKLDRFRLQPTEITIVEVYEVIIEINQLIVVLGGNVDKLETKLDDIAGDLFSLDFGLRLHVQELRDLRDDLYTMWDELDAVLASNARIEDKLNRLLGYPAAPDRSLLTLTVTPELVSASDHTATLEGAAGTVEGAAVVNVYWLERDNWRPGATDPFYFDTITANADGSFSLTKDGWGSSWPQWCEVTQTNAEGESAPVRVYLSTVMIEA